MTTDEQLILQIRAGNQSALTELYKRYYRSLRLYCDRILGNSTDAEDAVQDTFLKVHQEIQALHDPSLFKCWLFRIARNEALMKMRRKRWNVELDSESLWDLETPHEQLVALETTALLQKLVMELKTEYREALMLRESEHLSYAQIASIIGVTESIVKVRIFRARHALTNKLKKHLG